MELMFSEYRLADAMITKLTVEDADVRIIVRNSQEELAVLVFDDIVGMECLSFINTPLSHGVESERDDFLRQCCDSEKELPTKFRSFQFFSAWSDAPILKIVTRSFTESPVGQT